MMMSTNLEGDGGKVLNLGEARLGERVRVQRLAGQPAVCHRLRELGFCEEAEVRVIQKSGAMLCLVCGAKVCLSRQLAENIFVVASVA
jgi:Fe2+ transport system protein FeoA